MAVYSTRLSSTLVVRSARSKSSLPLAVIQSAALFLKRRPAEGCEMATWAGNCWPNRSGPCGEEKASTQESVAEAMQRTRRKLLHPISKDHRQKRGLAGSVIPLSALQPRSEQERDLRWGLGISRPESCANLGRREVPPARSDLWSNAVCPRGLRAAIPRVHRATMRMDTKRPARSACASSRSRRPTRSLVGDLYAFC